MVNITSSDSLFISASAMGRQFYNFVGNGLDSFNEIINLIRNSPMTPQGMVMVTVRNASQGWSHSRAFYNV